MEENNFTTIRRTKKGFVIAEKRYHTIRSFLKFLGRNYLPVRSTILKFSPVAGKTSLVEFLSSKFEAISARPLLHWYRYYIDGLESIRLKDMLGKDQAQCEHFLFIKSGSRGEMDQIFPKSEKREGIPKMYTIMLILKGRVVQFLRCRGISDDFLICS